MIKLYILAVVAGVFSLGWSENQFVFAQSGTRSPGELRGSGSRGMSSVYPSHTYRSNGSPAGSHSCGQSYYPRYGGRPVLTYAPGCGSTYHPQNMHNQMLYGSGQRYQPMRGSQQQPASGTGSPNFTNRDNLNRIPSGYQLMPLNHLPVPVPAK